MTTYTFTTAFLFCLFFTGDCILCYICDSFEGNCLGSICTGNACIKREAYIDGFVRVQKMCQSMTRPYMEYCDENVLWKGTKGTECICQTDYCNSSSHLQQLLYVIFCLLYFSYFL